MPVNMESPENYRKHLARSIQPACSVAGALAKQFAL